MKNVTGAKRLNVWMINVLLVSMQKQKTVAADLFIGEKCETLARIRLQLFSHPLS